MNKQKISALTDILTVINSHFTEQLAGGTIPWHASWMEHPKDIHGQPFTGINLWLLANNDYSRNVYLSKPQIRNLKATIKKGECGHVVITSRESRGKRSVDYHEVYYYNIDQVLGINVDTLPPLMKEQRIAKRCIEMVERMSNPPTIIDSGSSLFYSVKEDTIYLPTDPYFKNDRQLYSALFYALVQSTGHIKRLYRETCEHRNLLDPKLYSCEELVAEMGSTLLCSYAGIEPWYVTTYHANAEGWLKKMQKDPTLVSIAAMNADHAVDYILNLSRLKGVLPPDGIV